MATVAEIRAQIAACDAEAALADADWDRAIQEENEAVTRQELRRKLEKSQQLIASNQRGARNARERRRSIDLDHSGPHLSEMVRPDVKSRAVGEDVAHSVVDCDADVVAGEIEWKIKGFSWLQDALVQNDKDHVSSPEIHVADHRFNLVYSPAGCEMGGFDQVGSLAILHFEHPSYEGVAFRYTISIKSKERGYVQWGDAGHFCTTGDAENMLFGPDVCDSPGTPRGIFGMSHSQLKESEWVIDDVLSAKLEVHVRPNTMETECVEYREVDRVVVPPPRLCDNLLLLFDNAVGNDVTFKVQGETIKAHSQILSASSEVLQRLFSSGMQESTSKEVTIKDCEPEIFKAFLRYLYSDSFAPVESLITSMTSNAASSATSGTIPSTLQQLLALSHKYQVTRLQAWCESKLIERISIDEACSVLVQAHLYEAKQLEKRCLDFIAANMSKVANTESFASLSQQWPQVSLKITLRLAHVSEDIVDAAMNAQENVRKRKRDD